MDVSGNKAKVWVNEHQKRDGGKWYDYNVGIGKKKQDGTYVNMYIRVKFAKELGLPDDIPNGTMMENYEGYMTIDDYTTRDGEVVKRPLVIITKADFPELDADIPDSYEQLDEDILF